MPKQEDEAAAANGSIQTQHQVVTIKHFDCKHSIESSSTSASLARILLPRIPVTSTSLHNYISVQKICAT